MAEPTAPIVPPSSWFKDAAERVASTFLMAVIGYLSTVVAPDDWTPTAKLVLSAVVASIVSGLKAVLAKHVGNPESASLVG